MGIALTMVSALIPTGQSLVATDFETTSITGETLVALPCEGSPGALHERHGIPLDLIWYTHCEGTHILAFPLIINLIFWSVVVTILAKVYKCLSRRFQRQSKE
jgi:hypothetical protein